MRYTDRTIVSLVFTMYGAFVESFLVFLNGVAVRCLGRVAPAAGARESDGPIGRGPRSPTGPRRTRARRGLPFDPVPARPVSYIFIWISHDTLVTLHKATHATLPCTQHRRRCGRQ
jgi:hypothetical protein